jgi:hypothetical protein
VWSPACRLLDASMCMQVEKRQQCVFMMPNEALWNESMGGQ